MVVQADEMEECRSILFGLTSNDYFYPMRSVIIIISGLLMLVSCKSAEQDPLYRSEEIFRHGVASGDPLNDRVIIWTRISSPFPDSLVSVEWQLSRDGEFRDIVKAGSTQTSSARDFTVKADPDGLIPDSQYYFRFRAFGTFSPIGMTRTAPAGSTDSLRFAVVSCSNYEWGYFNAYRHIAMQPGLSAVIHLGDYIYEYGPGTYGDTTMGRIHEPPREILSLSDYRTRYAQYRLDPDLQEVHRRHPFITIWDDHEISNNAYTQGAQNHQADEGDYMSRREIARQVYYEWMPVREGNHLYRNFSFGSLADLIMLDERLAGRTAPVESPEDSLYADSGRTMLGEEQFRWMTRQLVRAQARWKIIGNQVIFTQLNIARENMQMNMDAWDGYPYEQARFAKMLEINQFENIVFITGDTHSSWAFESVIDLGNSPESDLNPLAIEFGTTSVNSANSNESYPDSVVIVHEELLAKVNPHLKYVNLRDHGYLMLTLTPEYARGDFYFTRTNRQRQADLFLAKQFWVPSGKYQLLTSEPE